MFAALALKGLFSCVIWFSRIGKHYTDICDCCNVPDQTGWNSLHGTLIYVKDFTLLVVLLTRETANTMLVHALPLFLHKVYLTPSQLDCYCTGLMVKIADTWHPDKPFYFLLFFFFQRCYPSTGERGDKYLSGIYVPARW